MGTKIVSFEFEQPLEFMSVADLVNNLMYSLDIMQACISVESTTIFGVDMRPQLTKACSNVNEIRKELKNRGIYHG